MISSDAAETVSSASPTSDATLLAGCSVVDFCNAPGSEGTRCRQQGCGVQSAVNECKSEVPGVCGSPVSPWIFVTLDGVHHSSRDAIAPARSARPASATSRSATCSV